MGAAAAAIMMPNNRRNIGGSFDVVSLGLAIFGVFTMVLCIHHFSSSSSSPTRDTTTRLVSVLGEKTNQTTMKTSLLRFVLNATELTEAVHASFHPTPWQDTTLPFCNRQQVIDGAWHETLLEDGPPYITPTVHLRCHDREYYDRRPFPSYKWVPHDADNKGNRRKWCEFTKFRTTLFCTLLQQATVLIVGDSLSWEHYASLVQLLGVQTKQGYQHQSKAFAQNIQQPVCNGNTRIVYRRDDRLQAVQEALQETFPTVLVLNRGAHYVNDSILQEDMNALVLPHVRQWLHDCETFDLQCHLFWRTSVPGHPLCWYNDTTEIVNSKPSDSLKDMEARIANTDLYDNKTIHYHWMDYQPQNVLMEQYWKDSALPHRILDAYYLNVLRPDDHRAHQLDCLHNCYPGKMDVYSQLLLHWLRQDRTIQAVDNQVNVIRDLGWSDEINMTTHYDKKGWEAALEKGTTRC